MPWLVHASKIFLQMTFSCFWLSVWFNGSVHKSEWSPVTFFPCISSLVFLANTSHSLGLFTFTASSSNWLVFYFYVHFWFYQKLKTTASRKLLCFWQQGEKQKQQTTTKNHKQPTCGAHYKWNDCFLSPASLCQQFTF